MIDVEELREQANTHESLSLWRDEITELLDRLEAAERERDHYKTLAESRWDGAIEANQRADELAAHVGRLSNALSDMLTEFPTGDFNCEKRAIDAGYKALAEAPETSPRQHPDSEAVDRFALTMKLKLAAAREKGRAGWDDPDRCSVELLADLLVEHLQKVNRGNYVDIANLAMMLHLRMASPELLASEFSSRDAEAYEAGYVDGWDHRAGTKPEDGDIRACGRRLAKSLAEAKYRQAEERKS